MPVSRDRVGVQLHLRKEGTPYYDLPRAIAAVKDLGVGHVRDSLNVGWPTQNAQLGQVADECGVKLTLTARMSDTIDGFIKGVVALGDRVVAVEGVNEWDNTGRSDWVAELRTHQAALYAAVKKAMPGMPVLPPALADAAKAAALGPVPCDLGNAHAYPNGAPQSWLAVPVKAASSISSGKPVVVTETGYTNALHDPDVKYHHPVTEAVAGGHMADLVTAHLAAGAPRVFVYELFDQGPDDTDVEHGFGLLRNDGTPKPAYTALKNLLKEADMPTPADTGIASFDCPQCKAAPTKPCVTASGVRTTIHARRFGRGEGWLARQGEVDRLTFARDEAYDDAAEAVDAEDSLSHQLDETTDALASVRTENVGLRATVTNALLTLKARDDTIAALTAEVQRLTPKPPVVVEPKHPIPADAVWVHPQGNDANPGTEAKPRVTPLWGKVNAVSGGTYNGAAWYPPAGKVTTLIIPEGQTAVLEGKGSLPDALRCSGLTKVYGDVVVQNYKSTSTTNGSNAPVYFGGTSVGSEIDGMTIQKCNMAALGFQVGITLRNLTVADMGYSGIMGTTGDGTVLDRVKVSRVNLAKRGQDGQLGAVKITRSANVSISDSSVDDAGGIHGLWLDVSCRNPHIVRNKVTGSASIGIHVEQAQGGIIAGNTIDGPVFGMGLLASGALRVWGNKVTAASVAMNLQQERLRNDGSKTENLSKEAAPWWTVNNEVCNNDLTATGGHRIAFMAYADGPAKGMLDAPAMLSALRGNVFGGSVQLGKLDGTRPTIAPAALGSVLGAKYSNERQPVPADIAALLG